MDPEKTCCFTGHRPPALPGGGDPEDPAMAAVLGRLETALDEMLARDVRDFLCGGALGFDLLAAEAVLRRKAAGEEVRLHMVLPCRDQSAGWAEAHRARYEAVLRAADSVRFLQETYTRWCMQARDRAMVDASRWLIAYCVQEKGGAAYTLAYARKKRRSIVMLDGAGDQTVMTLEM